MADLVAVLRAQHHRGRALTDRLRALAAAGISDDAARAEVRKTVGLFSAMYRPHAAREDTVLFPALRDLVSEHEYAELGERFEEHRLFGTKGFTGVVAELEQLEQALNIAALERFTPP